MNNSLKLVAVVLCLGLGSCSHNIVDFGAISNSTEDTDRAFLNTNAMIQAIAAANASEYDRTVLVPVGYTFVMMPIISSALFNITFEVNGVILASQDYQNWPFSGGCY